MPEEPRRNVGQVVEWLVWANLVAHSPSPVHLFLPLDDRGVDGILRRPADGAMVALQVKGRTRPAAGSHLDLEILDWSLHDDAVRWVVVLLEPGTTILGPDALVTDTATIRELAVPCTGVGGLPAHRLATPLPPPPGSPWAPFACPTLRMAERLLPEISAAATVVVPEPPESRAAVHWMAALAEVEVMRLLAGVRELNVFKSFPDIELSEYVSRRSPDGAMRGVQVKCVGIDAADDGGSFFVSESDLQRPTSALIVVLAWRHDLGRFDDHALLFPAARMVELGHRSEGRWVGAFCPEPKRRSRFAEVTVRRDEIGQRVAALG